MIDAYLNDYHSFQPTALNSKQLNSYLFIDLHSTSSDTFAERNSKKNSNDNTTTSGYDTSTGGEDKSYKNSFRYRRRRSHNRQRQRRRSTLAFKRAHGPRFLMRERSLPNTLIKLPQLRQQNHLFDFRGQHSSSTISNMNQDLLSSSFSVSTDDYNENHSYHIQPNRPMDIINEEEEKPSTKQQTCFFEMVSTHRGDESDMPNYEDLPRPFQSPCNIGNGIAYINESIIV